MRVVVAPDSFKESLSAQDAAEAMTRGVQLGAADADVVCIPLADGGEGTVDTLLAAKGGERVVVTVTGPLGAPVEAAYGLLDGGKTAIIEMSAASGLALIPPNQRNAGQATTRGTGELMADALDRGVTHMIVGLGGSATTDGGAGMAQALGWRLLDADGRDLDPGGFALERLEQIDGSKQHAGLRACDVRAACDVTNPLYGPNGAAQVYGPQKGATPEDVARLDRALRRLDATLKRESDTHIASTPGAGAAGGLGAGVVAFAGGRLSPGFDLVAEAYALDDLLEGADLVLTGEGRLDSQTVMGKTIAGLASRAAEQGIPVVVLAGALGPGWQAIYEAGVTAAFAIQDGPTTLEDALRNGSELLEAASESVARLCLATGVIS